VNTPSRFVEEGAVERRFGTVFEPHAALLIVEVGRELPKLFLGRRCKIKDRPIARYVVDHGHSPFALAHTPDVVPGDSGQSAFAM
jgi:hypothetical protein